MEQGVKSEYIEKIYAGWLAKIIGIRLGAPVEGWTYEEIKDTYGEIEHYLVDYRDFAADDDSTGPLFLLRALEDGAGGLALTRKAVSEALLNYAPFEHGFFWWGGYGVSTEHTAYLNLRAGIPALRSGSIAQNGLSLAEQIGGQIFIDTWGLVCPGNPDLAAQYAAKAAAVTHDGNGVYGGVFVASCIACAFDEPDIRKIIEKGLSYIPADCEYARVVRAVTAFYDKRPDTWRECFRFIYENFGYDRYPGSCHIIPNSAVMILGLLYGEGDFSRTITITTMCGWDTDCNAGNAATIMGVASGLSGIDYERWRAPINDFLVCSSVAGALNIQDIPYGASYIARLAWAISGEELPSPYRETANARIDSCHFEYPGSTHAIRVRTTSAGPAEARIVNTDETAHSGKRSLKVRVKPRRKTDRVFVYKKTYYTHTDFHDSRYDPAFSPLLYPGQSIHGSVFLPGSGAGCQAALYARNSATGELLEGERTLLKPNEWTELCFRIPALKAALLDEAGFVFDSADSAGQADSPPALSCMIDDLYFDGESEYTIDFSQTTEDVWNSQHREVMQFTRLKGLFYLENGWAHLSCADFAEAYTGRHDWTDYTASFTLKPLTGQEHFAVFRVQGAIRSYAAGFSAPGKLALLKNAAGWSVLAQAPFTWEHGREYTLTISCQGPRFTAAVDGRQYFALTDSAAPYLSGGIGLSVRGGSHCACRLISVSPIAPPHRRGAGGA